MLKEKYICEADIPLMHITDCPNEVVDIIKKGVCAKSGGVHTDVIGKFF
jgi:hypothetical protein